MPAISILLPVYNSLKGTKQANLLPQMLDSVLNQTFRDFELLIVDNQSTDNTAEVCKTIAAQDNRVKVYIDTERRPAEDAQSRLMDIAKGEFILLVADDDLINYYYLETLIDGFNTDKKTDMVYTNGSYITMENIIMQNLITSEDGMYGPNCYANFYKAIHKRNVLGILNGLFRKDILQTLLPYTPFDELGANMDNLLMAKFFLNKYNISFINKDMYYYRNRDRSLDPDALDFMPSNPILIWVYYARHQLHFYNAVYAIIDETNHGERTEALKIATLDSCLNQCINLLNWVDRDMVKDVFEKTVINEIYAQFKSIYELKLPCLAETPAILTEQQNIMRLRCKILEERVMGYIKTVVQNTTLVVDTQKVIKKIKEYYSSCK